MRNRIRIARGTNAKISINEEKVPAGVPFYDTDNNRLYISKDSNKEMHTYTPKDSIIAFQAENAIKNSNNTYSGFTQDANNILKANNNETISKRVLIGSSNIATNKLTLTEPLAFGNIYELIFETGMGFNYIKFKYDTPAISFGFITYSSNGFNADTITISCETNQEMNVTMDTTSEISVPNSSGNITGKKINNSGNRLRALYKIIE